MRVKIKFLMLKTPDAKKPTFKESGLICRKAPTVYKLYLMRRVKPQVVRQVQDQCTTEVAGAQQFLTN